MLKVLRKYNKIILVVGGTLLLIAFLVPQAIQQVGKARMGRAIGSMDGQKVTLATFDQAHREFAALREFFRHMDRDLPLALEDRREAEHWLLLTREAEQAGMVGGANEGATLLPILAQALAQNEIRRRYGQLAEYFMQSQPEQVEQLVTAAHQVMAQSRVRAAGATQMTLEGFDLALAKLRGVTRMLDTYRYAERISDRETVAIAKGLADTVIIDSVFLAARRLADESLEPTPEELAAHFELFRETKPGEGEFGIGYYLPARVKLEWIELSRPAIQDAIKISLLDATKHWQQNRDRFPALFEEEREGIETELRRTKTDEVMSAADAFVRAEIARIVRPLDRQGDYKVIPADWDKLKPDLIKIADDLIASLAASDGVSIPTPAVYVKDSSWLDPSMVSSLPGIGASAVRFGQQTYSFPQIAFSVRELAGETVLGLQMGVPAVDLPAQGRDGSRYFYTVLGTAPEAVPQSIDEVLDRKQVVADWRALRRYEVLAGSVEEFASRSSEEGLESLAESFGYVKVDPPPEGEEETPAPEPEQRVVVLENGRVLENSTTGLLNAQNIPEVISGVRERAAGIDPLTPIGDVPLGERIVAVRVPSKLGVLVAQINGVQPLTWENLPVYADYATRVHWQQSFAGVGIPVPFRFDPLRQRHAFSLKRAEEERPEDEAAGGSEGGAEPEGQS